MKLYFTLLLLLVAPFFGIAQTYSTVKGKIVKSENLGAMESVNIVNLNQVIGTTTNSLVVVPLSSITTRFAIL